MNDVLRTTSVIVATVAVIVVNGLANALPLNGKTTGEISDGIEVWFTPAGYVFSIWGLIYLGLIAFSIYQATPAGRAQGVLRGILGPYLVASAANAAWIFAWHYGWFDASLAVMVVLLASLVAIYLRLDIGRGPVPAGLRWAVHAPFSVYLGWITVATIANTTSVLWLHEWGGLGVAAEVWTAIVLGVASVVGVAVAYTRADGLFLLVLAWAFAGIYAKHPDVPWVSPSAASAGGLALLLALGSAAWPALSRGRAP